MIDLIIKYPLNAGFDGDYPDCSMETFKTTINFSTNNENFVSVEKTRKK